MMSASPSFAFHAIDASHLDDTMDVASSPVRQPEDVDVELDSVRDASVYEEEMLDDPVETIGDESEVMNDLVDENLPDDDMLDDNNPVVETDIIDYNMDAPPSHVEDNNDDDILYEEEEIEEVEVHDFIDQASVHEVAELDMTRDSDDAGLDQTVNRDNLEAFANQDTIDTGFGPEDNESEGTVRAETPKMTPAAEDPQTNDLGLSELAAEPQTLVETLPAPNPDHEIATTLHTVPEGPDPEANTGQDPTHRSYEPEEPQQEIHPVTLVYLDEEMSLFPPKMGDDSTVYFLSDASLAFEPLHTLLAACRELLTGTLDHHDELVIDIPGLGLHISEDSKYASEITLAQILDVYLRLCHNDPYQEPQPLYCQLNSRVSLASQYAYLASAGAEGKTYAEIVADHVHTPLEDESEEQEDEQPVEEEILLTNSDNTQPADEQPNQEQATQVEAEDDENQASLPTGKNPEASAEGTPEIPFEALGSQPNSSPRLVESNEPALATEVQTLDDPAYAAEIVDNDQSESAVNEELATDEIPHKQDELEAEYEHVSNNDETEPDGVTAEGKVDEDYEDDGEGEGEDLFAQEHVEPPPEGVNTSDQRPEDEDEAYNDEELLPLNDASDPDPIYSTSHPDQEHPLGHDSTQLAASVKETNGSGSPPQDADQTDQNETHLEASVENYELATESDQPITPSKAKLTKRKIEDEDEFDLLDISTPEPKRRRPS